jgi:hypothetical protein
VAAWLLEQHREGAGVVAATHSLDFLNLPSETIEPLLATRDAEGWTILTPIGATLLDSLSDAALVLGLSRSQVIQLARGVIVVVPRQAFHGQRKPVRLELARDYVVVTRGTSPLLPIAQACVDWGAGLTAR